MIMLDLLRRNDNYRPIQHFLFYLICCTYSVRMYLAFWLVGKKATANLDFLPVSLSLYHR